MVTPTAGDVFVIVTEYVTGPPGSLSVVGSALFDTLIDDGLSGRALRELTNTHVTVSPAASSIEPGELPSLQVADVSVHPAGVDSSTE
jgi:hypothetical protein